MNTSRDQASIQAEKKEFFAPSGKKLGLRSVTSMAQPVLTREKEGDQ